MSGLLYKTISFCSVGIFLLLNACFSLADGPERKSIGDDATTSTAFNELGQKWVGKQLVFLEILKSDNVQEYSDFSVVKPPKSKRNTMVETKPGYPVYNKFAGITVTVTKVWPYQEISGKPSIEFVFLLNEPTTNTNIITVTKSTFLSHLAYADRLQIAKSKWLNKTIYSKNTHLYQYDATLGKETTIEIPCGQALTVTDVMWGMDESNPIWIVVKSDTGRHGYYQISEGYSPTNILCLPGADNEDENFFDADPRTLPDWNSSILNDINSHLVTIGMTSVQVVLSIGNPEKTNKYTGTDTTTEQWIYPHKFVYLHYGKVTDIQDL